MDIVSLTRPLADAAAQALADAFFRDPLYVWMLPDSVKRRKAGAWFFRRVLEYGIRYGVARTDVDAAGAALWLPPGNSSMTPVRTFRAGFALAPFRIGFRAFSRFVALGSVLDRAHKRHAPGRHYYLLLLGVAPSHQRGGIGAALLREGLRRADAEHVASYLETMGETNIPYYERHGFRVVEEMHPGEGPDTWAMVREPGT